MRFPRPHRRLLLPALLLTLFSNLGEAATEYIDFGSAGTQTLEGPSGRFWNNVTDGTLLLTPISLFDSGNVPTGISLTLTSRFNGANTGGTTASTLYPSSTSSDSLFGNTGTGFNGIAAPNPAFKLSGLTPGVPYTFTFYASRIGAGGDLRTTDYFVGGSINGMATLNVSENINGTATVAAITPTAAGEITVMLAASPTNTNANKFIYLGALTIESVVVPEPTSAGLLAGGGLLLLAGRRRKGASVTG